MSSRFAACFLASTLAVTLALAAQFERRSGIMYLKGCYNFATGRAYSQVNAYLNVIDIGHGELAERLLTNPAKEDRTVKLIEQDLFEEVRPMFLDYRRAPRFAPAEETVAPESVKVAWKVNAAFDWTHYLHRQVYDILSDDCVKDKKEAIREAYRYYRSEPERVFPGNKLKSMDMMDNQWFSQYWREKYPRFNGAIWAYHWLQLALNEAMLEPDKALRDRNVERATETFRKMFEDPSLLPRHMPMAHEVAPTFYREFPEVSNTFDNLHTFHDIYNDILAIPAIEDKRAEVYAQLKWMLDPNQHLETMPAYPLPPIPPDRRWPLILMNHHEHMLMMILPVEEQLRFLKMPAEERAMVLEQKWPEVLKHLPLLAKKGPQHKH